MNLFLDVNLIFVLRYVLMHAILHFGTLLLEQLYLLFKELYPLRLLMKLYLLFLKHNVNRLVMSFHLVFISKVLYELFDLTDLK